MAKVIVGSGFVAKYPQGGGVFSVVLQYLLGLRKLGCEVCWLELLWGQGPGDRELIRTFADRLKDFDLQDAFCLIHFPEGSWPATGNRRAWYGWSRDRFTRFCAEADLLLDLCASIRPPELLGAVRRTALLDLDPGFMQLWIAQGQLPHLAHDLFFTVGQNVGRPGCRVPTGGREWRHFWPPADVDLWRGREGDAAGAFSTVSQWWGGYPPVHFQGEEYDGYKRTEFLRFLDLPRLTGHAFELALNIHPGETADIDVLVKKGWQLRDAHEVTGTFAAYRAFVQRACAEFSVAKPGYVQSNSGWFSDRSACYLAAGRPVVVQDTGFGAFLPAGRGVLSFSSVEDAVAAVKEVKDRYAAHCRAAHEIARQYFAAETVLSGLLHDAGL
jgi:hypothetical protein